MMAKEIVKRSSWVVTDYKNIEYLWFYLGRVKVLWGRK